MDLLAAPTPANISRSTICKFLPVSRRLAQRLLFESTRSQGLVCCWVSWPIARRIGIDEGFGFDESRTIPWSQQHCFDPETEQVYDDDEANKLLRDRDRGYRTPFVVPEEV